MSMWDALFISETLYIMALFERSQCDQQHFEVNLLMFLCTADWYRFDMAVNSLQLFPGYSLRMPVLVIHVCSVGVAILYSGHGIWNLATLLVPPLLFFFSSSMGVVLLGLSSRCMVIILWHIRFYDVPYSTGTHPGRLTGKTGDTPRRRARLWK